VRDGESEVGSDGLNGLSVEPTLNDELDMMRDGSDGVVERARV